MASGECRIIEGAGMIDVGELVSQGGLCRRKVLIALGFTGVAAYLAGCATDGSLPSKPKYVLVGNGVPSDFQRHLDREELFGIFGIGGIDLTFGYGVPLLNPCPGRVREARFFTIPGNATTIEYGIIGVELTHQLVTYVQRYQNVDRNDIIGREGMSGEGGHGISHVHITVTGNAILCADEKRRFPDRTHSRNYLEPDRLEGRYGPGGQIPGTPYHWNFVLNPDKLTPDGKPLHESFWNPLDPSQDYDTPYLNFVQDKIFGGLQGIASRLKTKSSVEARILGEGIGRKLTANPLYEIINGLWILYETELKERTINDRGYGFKIRLESFFDDVREAGSLIKLTSPYIDPKNPQTILYMIQQNPQHEPLIRAYYDRFLPRP